MYHILHQTNIPIFTNISIIQHITCIYRQLDFFSVNTLEHFRLLCTKLTNIVLFLFTTTSKIHLYQVVLLTKNNCNKVAKCPNISQNIVENFECKRNII